jgi:hypothetical protein
MIDVLNVAYRPSLLMRVLKHFFTPLHRGRPLFVSESPVILNGFCSFPFFGKYSFNITKYIKAATVFICTNILSLL